MNIKEVRKSLHWHDLRSLKKGQVLTNILLPYPFLVLAWWSAWQYSVNAHTMMGFVALAGWFLFFASSFRQAHDGFHRTLGVGKKATDFLLWISSGLLITSNHAVRQTHLQHHRAPLTESDIEARFYKLQWWQAILGGVVFWLSLQKHGLALATHNGKATRKKRSNKNKSGNTHQKKHRRNRERDKIILDFLLIAIVIIVSILLAQSEFYILLIHVAVMCVGNSFVGFVSGWCVHHDCDHEDEASIARTERNRFINLITFNLLYHQEHHLFPAIPTNNLPKLAERLDAIAPELTRLRVVGKDVETSNVQHQKSQEKNIQNNQCTQ